MSLASAIRSAMTGRRMKSRLEDEKPEDAEDDDKPVDAEGDEEDKPEAEDDDKPADAEDDEEKPADAEDDDDETDAEEDDEDKSMSASARKTFAKGRRAERKRIAAILSSPSAEANPGLAAHLAFATADRPKKALAVLKAGGASAASSLGKRMNARGPSGTGRGGDTTVRSRDAGAAWDGALAKAGVKLKGK
jgi:hypothetical protein